MMHRPVRRPRNRRQNDQQRKCQRTNGYVSSSGYCFFRGSDEGSGTVLGAMMIAVAAILLMLIAVVGRVFICHTQVRGLADTAAVSAASALMNGNTEPCLVASQVLSSNGAKIESCEIDGEDIQVAAVLSTGVPLIAEVSALSRAGPELCE